MSESLPFEVEDELRRSDRGAYFEQLIFVRSPFGTGLTATLIFLLLAGLYLLLASLGGMPVLVESEGSYALDSTARLALILSLMLTVILWIQRFTRLRQRNDTLPIARVLKGGMAQAAAIAGLTPTGARLGRATLLGTVIGLAFDYGLYFSPSAQLEATFGARLWFSFITLVLVMTFTRGVELTRTGARSTVEIIENGLIVDLLRIDELTVWGRGAARFALIWFVISAVTCLLFVSSQITVFTIVLLAGCLVMGVAAFVGLMAQIHRKIVGAKQAELERVRREIDAVRGQIGTSADASARIQGLLAYEARISAVHEWPFDQTTLMRVAASAFILTVPWFGQAMAAFVVEHLSAVAK